MKKHERFLAVIALILNLLWFVTNLALAQVVSEMGCGCDLCDPYRRVGATCINTFTGIRTNCCPSYDRYGTNWRGYMCFRWFPPSTFLCINSCRRDWYECNGYVIPPTRCLGPGYDCQRILPPVECTAQVCP
ncbi:hypothetical protein GG496_001285 [Candidatus Fervidibacteria bacterium JGI MDM2 JNZ-1-D12]